VKRKPSDCVGGPPRFFLLPTRRLPARRLFQGLAIDFILLVVALVLAHLFGTSAAQHPVRPTDKAIRIALYAPRSAKKRPSNIGVSRVKNHDGRRFSPPSKTMQASAATLDPPVPVLNSPADLVPQLLQTGLPLPSPPALAVLQIKVGVTKPSAAPPCGSNEKH
jgi:hypothetical protein